MVGNELNKDSDKKEDKTFPSGESVKENATNPPAVNDKSQNEGEITPQNSLNPINPINKTIDIKKEFTVMEGITIAIAIIGLASFIATSIYNFNQIKVAKEANRISKIAFDSTIRRM